MFLKSSFLANLLSPWLVESKELASPVQRVRGAPPAILPPDNSPPPPLVALSPLTAVGPFMVVVSSFPPGGGRSFPPWGLASIVQGIDHRAQGMIQRKGISSRCQSANIEENDVPELSKPLLIEILNVSTFLRRNLQLT
jgi:hypothetical protein